MTKQIALLRAVNLGGKTTLAMADLRALCADLGFEDARTLLQSGNLVLDAGRTSPSTLGSKLETALTDKLGLKTDVLVRTAKEWRALMAANPFSDAAKDDPSHLVVMPLKKAPAKDALAALRAAIKGRESVEIAGRELYIIYPDGIGRSKLTTKLIESKLATRGTGRNWNTVVKLAALVGS
jgi:uncharacterized protein (DUF1697 family)